VLFWLAGVIEAYVLFLCLIFPTLLFKCSLNLIILTVIKGLNQQFNII